VLSIFRGCLDIEMFLAGVKKSESQSPSFKVY